MNKKNNLKSKSSADILENKYIKFKLTPKELEVYDEWWRKLKNKTLFQADYRESVLKYFDNVNKKIKVEEIGDMFFHGVRRAWWASSSKQYQEWRNHQDRLEIKIDTLQKTVNILVQIWLSSSDLKDIPTKDFLNTPDTIKIYENDRLKEFEVSKKKRAIYQRKIESWGEKQNEIGFKNPNDFDMHTDYYEDQLKQGEFEYESKKEEEKMNSG